MTSREAREILLRYRPGTGDEDDREVRGALTQAARDPELAAWLDEQRRFQQGVRDGFRSVEVPAGLREQILSEKRSHFHWLRSRRVLMGVAASVAALVLVGISLWLGSGPDEEARFATFRSRMVKTVLRGYAMDLETQDVRAIRNYLGTNSAHADWRSPPGLEVAPVMGCAVLPWRNHPATMICYGSGGRPKMWLFIVDADSLPDPPAAVRPVVETVNRLTTVSWSADGRTYVLASEAEEAEDLLKLFEGGT